MAVGRTFLGMDMVGHTQGVFDPNGHLIAFDAFSFEMAYAPLSFCFGLSISTTFSVAYHVYVVFYECLSLIIIIKHSFKMILVFIHKDIRTRLLPITYLKVDFEWVCW
jgi:hypothetical protein